MSAARTAEQRPAITNQQGRELLALMKLFYSDPKNRAAYEAWLAERTARDRTNHPKEDETV